MQNALPWNVGSTCLESFYDNEEYCVTCPTNLVANDCSCQWMLHDSINHKQHVHGHKIQPDATRCTQDYHEVDSNRLDNGLNEFATRSNPPCRKIETPLLLSFLQYKNLVQENSQKKN